MWAQSSSLAGELRLPRQQSPRNRWRADQAGEGKLHRTERDGRAVFTLTVQIGQGDIAVRTGTEIIFPQIKPLVIERVLAGGAGGDDVGVMDGISGVSSIMVDGPIIAGAPGDGRRTGNIGFHLVIAGLGYVRVPFAVIGRIVRVEGIQGQVSGVTQVVGKWVPVRLRAGGKCRVELRRLNRHLDNLRKR